MVSYGLGGVLELCLCVPSPAVSAVQKAGNWQHLGFAAASQQVVMQVLPCCMSSSQIWLKGFAAQQRAALWQLRALRLPRQRVRGRSGAWRSMMLRRM